MNIVSPLTEFSPWLIEAYKNSGAAWDSDSASLQLDLHKKEDSVAAIVLGILYAFTINPAISERAFRFIRDGGFLDIPKLARQARALPSGNAATERVSHVAPELVHALEKSYGRIPRLMAVAILRAADRLDGQFQGDPRSIYSKLSYEPRAVVDELAAWRARLQIKAYWVAREMRMQRVWVDPRGIPIDGSVCCVIDVQVRRALEHLGCAEPGEKTSALSARVWKAFGELYDYPLLWFGRVHCGRKPNYPNCPLGTRCVITNPRRGGVHDLPCS